MPKDASEEQDSRVRGLREREEAGCLPNSLPPTALLLQTEPQGSSLRANRAGVEARVIRK